MEYSKYTPHGFLLAEWYGSFGNIPKFNPAYTADHVSDCQVEPVEDNDPKCDKMIDTIPSGDELVKPMEGQSPSKEGRRNPQQ